VGGLLRGALGQGLTHRPGEWPWSTFIVNVIGALLLGYVIASPPAGRERSRYRGALLAVGFCGALSTFSTMMLELQEMIDGGRWALAVGYAAGSILCGLAAVLLGARLARRRGLAP
jgi:fluoride exporter